ncbi:MAG: SPFH domain-containing protein [Carnobacterium sp.]|uniref:Regulator of protease activity HflC, stomatin/prohibitin superfamily n=1 Tax=Carnobacterium viridans TaxID=174587 RepID=A0A1H0ZWH5_9LACT|nr:MULTISPECIES: SPFH domain-containing protein [Carnobacterium]UDE94430.1 prohibitin family protein [Carnobacterium viridans]SDQ31815.1 Regulator of protease activity HflC, stomatin/prohibitin superfamily [Carnobacterium viridans]
MNEKEYDKNSIKKIKGLIIGILVIILLVGGFLVFFEKIENGYVGVRYSMNGGVKDQTLSQGVKFVGLDKVTQYPIRLQTVKAEKLNLATEDGKATHVSITYAYKVDSKKVSDVFKEFGSINVEDIEANWLKAQLLKSSRAVVARYSLLDVTGSKSTEVQQSILEDFTKAVEPKGFLVEDVAFGVPDVDAETQKSIDEIIKAGQEKEKALLEADTAKTKADSLAYQKVKAAEAEAEANKKLSESISEELIKLKEVEARLEHGWVEVQTGEAIVDTNK